MAKRQIILECDELDYKAIQEAIAKRQLYRSLPEHDSNLVGVLVAEVCRGWMELRDSDCEPREDWHGD